MSTSFDHRQAGTTEAAWRTAGLDRLPALDVDARRLVVLAAHPDDETLGAGGLIAASARRGAEIVVVVATDGEASHPDSPTTSPADLARRRRAEVAAAVAHLAPRAEVHHLGLPDGALDRYGPTLAAALRTVLGRTPARLVTPWRDDRHPDHEACARAAQEVARGLDVQHWQYPVWAWHWAHPDTADLPRGELRRLPVTERDLAAKRAALAEHVSQHRPLSDAAGDEAILPPDVLDHFTRPFECFVVDARTSATTSEFDALYAASSDPWGLADRFYEKRKRALLLGALPRARFRRVFEPGCATGLLTAALAERADEVVAWDVAGRAVEQTRARTGGSRVRVGQGAIPDDWPSGRFDLVVLSEVAYYCPDLDALVDRLRNALDDDGVVVACHWKWPAAAHAHTAEEVHAALDGAPDAVGHRMVTHEERDFRLDVWCRVDLSVAQREGIVRLG